jgi:hypothetical protein
MINFDLKSTCQKTIVALLKTSLHFLGEMQKHVKYLKLESGKVLTSKDGFLIVLFNCSDSYAESIVGAFHGNLQHVALDDEYRR